MPTDSSKNRQFAINMMASLITFAVGLGIRFGLTPYIVRTIGPEAYGFIGLSANILTYTSLITIALNSMVGRFITIKYCEGNIDEANKYYASVFLSNIVLAFVITFVVSLCIIWLEYLINIPEKLVFDVKLLFALMAINNIIGLLAGTWTIATFIKNRLDLSNVRTIIGNVIKALSLILLFSFFKPHVWYLGLAGMFLTIYTAFANYRFTSVLTPELGVKKENFDFGKIVELLKSGVWSLISRLGEILGQGFDLLLANLYIGMIEMGYFAITKNVPVLILGLFQSISAVFAPTMTRYFAEKKHDELLNECHKSIRILSFFTAIPLTCLYVYGDSFYRLWLPTENSSDLIFLTVLGTFALPYTLPLESFWNIFTITNKLKYSTLFMLGNNVAVFLIVFVSMYIVESSEMRLFVLAGTRSFCGIIRGFVFLPMYGAHCLLLPKTTFYKNLFKALAYFIICLLICFGIKYFFEPNSWGQLILAFSLVTIVCVITGMYIVLSKFDRTYLLNKIKEKFF